MRNSTFCERHDSTNSARSFCSSSFGIEGAAFFEDRRERVERFLRVLDEFEFLFTQLGFSRCPPHQEHYIELRTVSKILLLATVLRFTASLKIDIALT